MFPYTRNEVEDKKLVRREVQKITGEKIYGEMPVFEYGDVLRSGHSKADILHSLGNKTIFEVEHRLDEPEIVQTRNQDVEYKYYMRDDAKKCFVRIKPFVESEYD